MNFHEWVLHDWADIASIITLGIAFGGALVGISSYFRNRYQFNKKSKRVEQFLKERKGKHTVTEIIVATGATEDQIIKISLKNKHVSPGVVLDNWNEPNKLMFEYMDRPDKKYFVQGVNLSFVWIWDHIRLLAVVVGVGTMVVIILISDKGGIPKPPKGYHVITFGHGTYFKFVSDEEVLELNKLCKDFSHPSAECKKYASEHFSDTEHGYPLDPLP